MTVSRDSSLNLYVIRNEINADCEYHCNALAARFPCAEEIDFVENERIPLEKADGVILTGSTASVYHSDSHDWIVKQETLIPRHCNRGVSRTSCLVR